MPVRFLLLSAYHSKRITYTVVYTILRKISTKRRLKISCTDREASTNTQQRSHQSIETKRTLIFPIVLVPTADHELN